MPKVKALSFFDHHGLRNAGDVFEVSEKYAAALVAKGLVTQDIDLREQQAKPEKAVARASRQRKAVEQKTAPTQEQTTQPEQAEQTNAAQTGVDAGTAIDADTVDSTDPATQQSTTES